MPYIRINNRDNFLISEVPTLHPDSMDYLKYWRRHKKRIWEGFWSVDSPDYDINVDEDVDYKEYETGEEHFRWMPPQLYFYSNFGTIEHNPEYPRNAPKVRMRPHLRDVEWEVFYNWAEARGFSGFEDDEEYTCNEDVLQVKDDPQLKLPASCYKKDGSLKKYVPTREYIRKLHKKPFGRACWENGAKGLLILAARGVGKDLEENTLVYTKEGPTPIRDINIGEEVFGADGKLTTVIDKVNYNNLTQYEVEFDDGRIITCGDGHLWEVYTPGQKDPIVLPLKEIRKRYKGYYRGNKRGHDRKIFVKLSEPVDFSEKEHKIDPYFLGQWLGDGSQHNTSITTMDEDTVKYIYGYADDLGMTVTKNIKKGGENKASNYLITEKVKGRGNRLKDILAEYDLINNKHIPHDYLYASYEQRMALFQGLMDSDGYCDSRGIMEFANKNKVLAEQTMHLARSFGIRCQFSEKVIKGIGGKDFEKPRTYYRVIMTTTLPVFRLKRKLDNIKTKYTSSYGRARRTKNGIVDIREVGVRPSVCIAVDNKDSLFLAGDYVVTHNSFSVAGVLYHAWMTDGEFYYNPQKKKPRIQLFIGSGMASKSNETMDKFRVVHEHLPGSWGEGTDFEPSPLSKIASGVLSENNAGNPWRHEYKVKSAGVEKTKGTGSKVIHGVFTAENPQAAAGTRPSIIVLEEIGLTGNISTIHASNDAALREGANRFGSPLYVGTGGLNEKIMETYPLFYNPKEYNLLAFPDEWENTGDVAFFIPYYYGMNQYKDENGNTDVAYALKKAEEERAELRKGKDSDSIDGHIMNYPLKPSEMFISKRGNIFPVDEAKQRLIELERDDLYFRLAKPVKLFFSDKAPYGIDYKIVDRSSVSILDDFPTRKGKSREGCVVIYKFPEYVNEEIPKGLYMVTVDPQKTDGEEGSDSAVQVWKTRKHKELGYDELVAEYYGRPYTGTERVNEIIEMLAMFYGNHPRSIAFESNVGNVYSYFFRKRKVYLLCPEVSTVFKSRDAGVTRNTKYGNSIVNKHDKAEALKYGRNFLLEEYKENDVTKILLQKIPSRRLLKEMIPYNIEKGNFDAVSSFLQYVIEREERANIVVEQLYEEQKQEDIYDFLDKKINKKDDYRSYRIPQTKNSLFPESF